MNDERIKPPHQVVAPTKTQPATVDGLNSFAFNLYGAVPREGNALLSPFSVAMALSLVELGARQTSAAALHKLLGVASAESYRAALQALVAQLVGDGKPMSVGGQEVPTHKLKIANSLWVAAGYKLATAFAPLAHGTYAAQAETIDVDKPAAAAARINTWTSDATGGKIKDIVPERAITKLTRLILINAIHFVGRWRDPFFEHNTKPAPFFVDGAARSVPVPTMANSHYFRAAQGDDATVLEMPYWDSKTAELAMTLVLPKARDGLAALEAKLTPARFASWVKALQSQMVAVRLPRWKAEATLRLAEVLEALGIGELFTTEADLSGISDEKGLHIDAVIHKTFIDVDEKGTEAAAATAIMAAGGGMPSKPLEFVADHPFLYVIRDTKSGTVLFVGRVTDPR